MKNILKKLNITRLRPAPEIVLYICLTGAFILFVAALAVPVPAWVKKAVFGASILLSMYDMILEAILRLIKKRSLDKNLLFLIGAVTAFCIGKAGAGAAAVLMLRVGTLLREIITEKITTHIKSRLDRRPETANAVINGAVTRVPAGRVKVGDIVSVAPGEILAFDGIVISGESALDTSAFTGDARLVPVTDGSLVTSGSVNNTGVLNVRVTMAFDEAFVAQAAAIVEEASERKAKPERRLARVTGLITPAVVVLAVLIGLAVPLIGGLPITPWLYRALTLLFVASGTVYSALVSITYFAGIARALQSGILFKGHSILDAVAHTTSVIFDKTGVLTTGRFQVTDIHAYEISGERLFLLAAYAEMFSNHPIARSIAAAAGTEPDESKASNYRELPGRGVEVQIGSVTVSAGNERMMAEVGITPDLSQAPASVVYIAVNGKYAGRILLRDDLKPDSQKAIADIKALGIDRIALFTGDKKEAAADVAVSLGIRELHAECLPDEKEKRLKSLREMQLEGDKLVFVGDGVADAALFQMADIAVTLGGFGRLEVFEPADVVVMTDEAGKIPVAITLARETAKTVSKSIIALLGVKSLLLLTVLIGIVPVWLAVFIDAAACIFAVFNAARAFGLHLNDLRALLFSKKSRETVDDEDF
ncbi:heavy metal translocating P-type ATPase [Oscillospiraceae bacterium WX1]